jgi:RNA polymerase sigma factor (sigma-70 family)
LNAKTTYSEDELVALLRQRDEKAFSYLYDNYSGALNGIIFSILPEKETASDVLQDVFVNIWKKIESYDTMKGRLFTWMLNIARNAAIDKLRSRGYKDSLRNRPIQDSNNESLTTVITQPVIEDVGLKKILQKLKSEQRQLIDLSYFQGYTHDEISKALNIPLGTVKTRIRSALITLRTMMQ